MSIVSLIVKGNINQQEASKRPVGASIGLGEGQYFGRIKGRNKNADAPLVVGFATTHCDVIHGLDTLDDKCWRSANLLPVTLQIVETLRHLLGQTGGASPLVVLDDRLIAMCQRPVDIVSTASASIDAHNSAFAPGFIQPQGTLSCLHQREERLIQLYCYGYSAIVHFVDESIFRRFLHVLAKLLKQLHSFQFHSQCGKARATGIRFRFFFATLIHVDRPPLLLRLFFSTKELSHHHSATSSFRAY